MKTVLPMPPSVNATYKTGRGVFYKDKKAHKWRDDALWLLKAWGKPMIGRCAVKIRLDGLRVNSDLDNRIKPILDALQAAGIIENDKLVDEVHVYRGRRGGTPEAEIEVIEICK